ncbi:DoxX family protein [Zobellia laminariae]|uniref:DoxX family protein n=1 Tax=Zobellia barbeyronii TaxID=2748009 RepID=A0ABS5WAA6_9FLAO|nr:MULTISPECIES: DoxX family protein [Zobellia]MBT2160154.1 DoxX family protein [Zobellia barbeyronii]MUH39689.1 DoxX family protein [Zobellia laminariae]WKX77816.1 DoxX family protein [Zobellia laminariae]
MKTQKALYWSALVLLTAIMLFSAFNYFTKYEMIAGFFEHLSYPTYLIYPLAIAKILGLIAIWGNFSSWLREWAYAGFFFDTLLAFFAHYITDGQDYLFAFIALIATLIAYFTGRELRP